MTVLIIASWSQPINLAISGPMGRSPGFSCRPRIVGTGWDSDATSSCMKSNRGKVILFRTSQQPTWVNSLKNHMRNTVRNVTYPNAYALIGSCIIHSCNSLQTGLKEWTLLSCNNNFIILVFSDLRTPTVLEKTPLTSLYTLSNVTPAEAAHNWTDHFAIILQFCKNYSAGKPCIIP